MFNIKIPGYDVDSCLVRILAYNTYYKLYKGYLLLPVYLVGHTPSKYFCRHSLITFIDGFCFAVVFLMSSLSLIEMVSLPFAFACVVAALDE